MTHKRRWFHKKISLLPETNNKQKKVSLLHVIIYLVFTSTLGGGHNLPARFIDGKQKSLTDTGSHS